MPTEIIGIKGTVILVCSMLCNTRTRKGTLAMRILNGIACVFLIIYGLMVPAYSSAIANFLVLIVNTYYTYKVIKDDKT